MDLFDLEQIVHRNPLVVTPETSVLDVMTLMSQVLGSFCAVNHLPLSQYEELSHKEKNSCILVVEKSQLVGIFTERDAVKLAASGVELSRSRMTDVMTRNLITITQSRSQNIFTILELMRQHKIRHLPVLSDQSEVQGIVTSESIRRSLLPASLLKLRLVEEVMSTKVTCVSQSISLRSIAKLMAESSVSCIVISEQISGIDNSAKHLPIGIVTERDILQFQALGLNLEQTQAETVMSTPLFCMSPKDSLWATHQDMQRRNVSRFPITGQNGELLGIITQEDLMRALDPVDMTNSIGVLQQQISEQTVELDQTNQQLRQEIVERQKIEETLRQAEQRYRNIFENALEGIYQSSPEGQFLNANPALAKMLGYTSKRELLESITDIGKQLYIDPERRNNYLNLLNEKGSITEFESQIFRKDGTVIWISENARIVNDENGSFDYFEGALQDITDRKHREENARFEERIQQEAIRTQVTELERLAELKNEFLSTVSHELRTPLTSIHGALGLLATGSLGTLSAKGERMISVAHSNTERLVRLINDLLDIERIESGKVSLSRQVVDLGSLAKQAADVMSSMADKAGIQLMLDCQSVRIFADPDRIVQAMTNLLSNAIKFSSPGLKVWLRVSQHEDQALLQVKDEGRGIPSAKLGVIFERFQQVDASDSHRRGGTGLGLAICRSITQQHDGRISVESTLGKGSTFSIALPLDSAHQPKH
jgi:PAS domain S-box-containing protein